MISTSIAQYEEKIRCNYLADLHQKGEKYCTRTKLYKDLHLMEKHCNTRIKFSLQFYVGLHRKGKISATKQNIQKIFPPLFYFCGFASK
jgi:hypothetical protein